MFSLFLFNHNSLSFPLNFFYLSHTHSTHSRFHADAAAGAAIHNLNGQCHFDNPTPLIVKLADDKKAVKIPGNIAHIVTTAEGKKQLVMVKPAEVNTNVYLAGLPPTFTKTDLDGLCCGFGRIVSSRVLTEKVRLRNRLAEDFSCNLYFATRPQLSGASRGVAFVNFASLQSAQAAIKALSGIVFTYVVITIFILFLFLLFIYLFIY